MDNQRKLPLNLILNHKVLFSVLSIQLLFPIFLAWKHFCYSDRPTNQNRPWLIILFSVISFSLRWIKRHFWNFWRIRFCKTLFETLFRRTIFIRGKGFRRVNDQLLICQNKTSVENSSSVKDFIIDRFFTKSLLVEKTNMLLNRSWNPHRPRIRPQQPGIHGPDVQDTWAVQVGCQYTLGP